MPTVGPYTPSANNAGSLVSDLVGGISDADPGAEQGIAVVGTDTTYGTAQFSLDDGADWTTINAANDSNALLLPAAPGARVRFLPSLAAPSVVSDAITFRAWDQTTGLDGVEGEYVDASVNGGSSAFSAATDQVGITVTDAVSGISPCAGPVGGGAQVTISGANLDNVTAVYFGGVAASSFTIESATQIVAISPANAPGTVDVTVVTPDGASAPSPNDLFSYMAAPAVTDISPPTGPADGGTLVTITGSGLAGATGINFGAVAASDFTIDSPTQITATSPMESAGTVDVTVTTAGGVSIVSSADQFMFVAVPAVTGVSPASGPVAGGTTVTITGTGFTAATAVDFGSIAADNMVIDAAGTQITATSPPESAGAVDVTVTGPAGTSATSSADQFRYVAAPVVSSIDTSSGSVWGNTLVNIFGSNLADATTAVFFGATPAAGFLIIGDNQIMAISPPGAGSVDVTVVNAGGSSAVLPAEQFTYVAAATLTWNGSPTGNWTDAQWSGAALPYPDNLAKAVVSTASIVQVTSSQAAYALEINNGGQVAIAAGAGLSVTTSASVTDGGTLDVDPNGAFSVGGTLTLDSGGNLTGGTIAAAAYLLDDGKASANLSGPGGLTKDTGGTAVLSGANSYAGGVRVNAGSLVVTATSALPDGTTLTIGGGGTFVFDPGQAATSVVAAGSPAVVNTPTNAAQRCPRDGISSLAAAVAASATSLTVVAGAVGNGPVTASGLSSSWPLPDRQVRNLSYGPVTAAAFSSRSPFLARQVRNLSYGPAGMSSATVDAVFEADGSAHKPTGSLPDSAQSAGAWAWLATCQSPGNSFDQKQKTGPAVESLDEILARYGL